MKKLFLSSLLTLLLIHILEAQQTITITTGPKWKDVSLYKSTKPGSEFVADVNYSQPLLSVALTGHAIDAAPSGL